jgi:acetoacetate decarboxylase
MCRYTITAETFRAAHALRILERASSVETGPGNSIWGHREFFIIAYRTDPQRLRSLVPEPLEIDEPLVKYEFIRMRRRDRSFGFSK